MTIYTTDGLLSSEKKDLIGNEVEVEVDCPEKKALANVTRRNPLVVYPLFVGLVFTV